MINVSFLLNRRRNRCPSDERLRLLCRASTHHARRLGQNPAKISIVSRAYATRTLLSRNRALILMFMTRYHDDRLRNDANSRQRDGTRDARRHGTKRIHGDTSYPRSIFPSDRESRSIYLPAYTASPTTRSADISPFRWPFLSIIHRLLYVFITRFAFFHFRSIIFSFFSLLGVISLLSEPMICYNIFTREAMT